MPLLFCSVFFLYQPHSASFRSYVISRALIRLCCSLCAAMISYRLCRCHDGIVFYVHGVFLICHCCSALSVVCTDCVLSSWRDCPVLLFFVPHLCEAVLDMQRVFCSAFLVIVMYLSLPLCYIHNTYESYACYVYPSSLTIILSLVDGAGHKAMYNTGHSWTTKAWEEWFMQSFMLCHGRPSTVQSPFA